MDKNHSTERMMMLPRLDRRSYSSTSVMHKHDFHQIVFSKTGIMDIEICGKGGKVDQSNAAFIPDGSIHEYSTLQHGCFIVLDISTFQILDVHGGYIALDYFKQTSFFEVTSQLRYLVDYAATQERFGASQVSSAWAQLLIADTLCRVSATAGTIPQSLTRACAYIDDHLGNSLSVAQIARYSGVSERSLLTLFRSALQTTPHAYVMRRRAKRAVALLKYTSKSIDEIAMLTGYADQSALTRSLRNLCGITPAKCRMVRL